MGLLVTLARATLWNWKDANSIERTEKRMEDKEMETDM